MATPNIITKEAKQFIIDNCTLTSGEMKKILREKYNVDASEVGIWEHLKVARQKAEEATRSADAVLSQTIAERVAGYAPKILARYERELERIESILDGTSHEFILDIADNGSRDKYWATKYTKLYDDLSRSYLALRPPVQTVRIESAVDPDVALMDTWTEEQIKAYEKFLASMETSDDQ
jgi:hypothetical protein